MLGAGHVGDDRMRAGGDQDGAGADLGAVVERDLVGAGHGRALGDDLDLVALEYVVVDALEPLDLGEHVVAQDRPVELALADVPAEAARVLEVLGEMGAVDEQLLGHAAADDAGAADAILLGDGDAGAMGGGDARGTHAARSGADHEQVIIIGLHSRGSSQIARSAKSVVMMK